MMHSLPQFASPGRWERFALRVIICHPPHLRPTKNISDWRFLNPIVTIYMYHALALCQLLPFFINAQDLQQHIIRVDYDNEPAFLPIFYTVN